MRIWKFPYGYVKIEVICKRLERFVNAALACGIPLHNISRLSSSLLLAVVPASRYDEARSLSADIGADIRVLKVGGASLLFRELLARKALILSLIAAIAAIFLLSKRILFIKIDCADSALHQPVLDALESVGAVRGISASSIDRAELSKSIADRISSIGFANVTIDGVVLRVETHSALERPADDGSRPKSIYSDKDCVILSVATFDGIAAVKPGDAIKKDQLLVSGDITPEQGGEGILVRADAEIIGEVAYDFSIRIDPNDLRPSRSGRSEDYAVCKLFRLSLSPSLSFNDCELANRAVLPFDAVFLPVFVHGGSAHEIILKDRELSKNEMLEAAEAELSAQIHRRIPEGAVIISKATELIWEDDGALTVRIAVYTYERIGYTRYL